MNYVVVAASVPAMSYARPALKMPSLT